MSRATVGRMRKLYELTGGKDWEPPVPGNPLLVDAVADGWLRRVDGRCGFERMKDTFVVWTPAAHAALQQVPA